MLLVEQRQYTEAWSSLPMIVQLKILSSFQGQAQVQHIVIINLESDWFSERSFNPGEDTVGTLREDVQRPSLSRSHEPWRLPECVPPLKPAKINVELCLNQGYPWLPWLIHNQFTLGKTELETLPSPPGLHAFQALKQDFNNFAWPAWNRKKI